MNNNIKESYCSFELSKLLKEKEFKAPTLCHYFEDGEFRENVLRDTTGMDYGSEYTVEFSELTENWNDGWVTKKNGDRCFGCSNNKGYFVTYSAPTHAFVLEWLRINFGIVVVLDYFYYDGVFFGCKWFRTNGDFGEVWGDNDGEKPLGTETIAEAYELALTEILQDQIK